MKHHQLDSLNRTFYGIETKHEITKLLFVEVLIVPFMELKQGDVEEDEKPTPVLIVPFMELKQTSEAAANAGAATS